MAYRFLGKDIGYWIELDNWALEHNLNIILEESARLRARIQQLEQVQAHPPDLPSVPPEARCANHPPVCSSLSDLVRALVHQEVDTYIDKLLQERP